MPTAPTIHTIPGMGNVAMNWYGSFATYQADTQFEPNFRQFDWVLEEEAPTPDLIDRVFNVPDGQAHYSERAFGGSYRTVPVLFPIIYSTACVNLMYCRINNKQIRRWRSSSINIFILSFVWHNGVHTISREKHFLMDWWKNQSFAIDEMKRLRDEQRVREGIYATQFIKDPIAEYRLKEWLTANRYH